MNRMLKCFSAPAVSSNLSPIANDIFFKSMNHRFRHILTSKNKSRSVGRLTDNNHLLKKRSETKRCNGIVLSKNVDTRPVILLPSDFRVLTFEQELHARPSTSHTINVNSVVEVLFSATGKEVEKYPQGKPNWEKLQHICIRLAESWPTFFLRKMDYTVFRDDVVLEDRIYGRTVRGVRNYMQYLGVIAVAGRILYPQIEMHVISITPILEDATVRVRWRIYYMNFLDFCIMLLRFKPFTDEYMKANGRITDGYSIYYADSNGSVYRHVLDKVIPDDSKGLAKGKLSLTQRILALLGGAPAQKQAAPSPS